MTSPTNGEKANMAKPHKTVSTASTPGSTQSRKMTRQSTISSSKTKPPIAVVDVPSPAQFKAWRKRLGLTQAEAAKALGYGLVWINMIERGKGEISKVTALAMIGLEASTAAAGSVAPAPTLLQILHGAGQLTDTELMHEGDLTPLAARIAALEGWGVFWDEDKQGFAIQRDDRLNLFESDDDAINHVKQAAKAGSRLHKIALRLTGEQTT